MVLVFLVEFLLLDFCLQNVEDGHVTLLEQRPEKDARPFEMVELALFFSFFFLPPPFFFNGIPILFFSIYSQLPFFRSPLPTTLVIIFAVRFAA